MKKYLVLGVILLQSTVIYAAPKATLIPFWNKSNESNTATIDHSALSGFLTRNYKKSGEYGYFNYQSISETDVKILNDYIIKLEKTPILQYNKKEQFAYWVNLYNAVTIRLILDNYPIKSIREIPNKLLKFGPWDQKIISVEGQKISLNNIEHGILRPIWKDPRIHFIVNCASIGCPNISPQAFTAQNANDLAESAAKNFLNGVRAMTRKGDTLVLTSLFDWYGEDFGKGVDDYLNYIRKYATPQTMANLNMPYNKVEYDYNWDLNELKFVP